MENTLRVKVSGPVATVTLTRSAVHNALDEQLTVNLTQALQKLGVAEMVRVVVIEAEGESFCAGADLVWLTRMTAMEPADAQRESMAQALLLDAIARCPKPVIAMVQGAALGLGVGIISAADMAIAAESASFALTEIRMGTAPSVSLPYVAAAIGGRACRRYALTGERFDAREALRLGLVHGVASSDRLAAARDHLIEACLKGAPKAQAAAKDLMRVVEETPMGPDLMRLCAFRHADDVVTDDAREGVAAAAGKRKANWTGGA